MRSTLLACLLLGFVNVAAAEVSVRDDEGATVIRMDGVAVGRLLNGEGLDVHDIILTAVRPAA